MCPIAYEMLNGFEKLLVVGLDVCGFKYVKICVLIDHVRSAHVDDAVIYIRVLTHFNPNWHLVQV